MCGIAGCIAPPGQVPDREALARMAAAMEHRGPDGCGIEVVGSVGLVNRRLSIVDPVPAADGPMRDPGSEWWLTYNGEVFNHLELRRELGGEWRTGSDTETVLRALATWGPAAVERFNGFFGLAALDVHGGRLHLIRDRFGVKPIYIGEWRGCVWFASEIQALLAAGLPRRARPEVVEHIIRRSWAAGGPGLLEGIDAVPAGGAIEIDLATLGRRGRDWWKPEREVDPELRRELAALDRASARRRLEEELRAAVSRRLMGDVPIGVLCSGGLDSSLVTAYAHDADASVHAYNASIPDQPEVDEGRWARRVCDSVGAELETVIVDAESWRAGLVGAVAHFEHPCNHPGAVPTAEISKLAHTKGVKVLLAGEAADELFGGYVRMLGPRAPAPLDGSFGFDPAALRHLASRAATRARDRRRAGDRNPSPEAAAFMRRRTALAREAYADSPTVRRRIEASALNQLTVNPLPPLINRLDGNGMQGSVEIRTPFLDPGVIRLALNMSFDHRFTPDSKGVLRDLVRERFGAEVADRVKQPFLFDVAAYIEPNADPAFLREGRLRQLFGRSRRQWAAQIRRSGDNERLRLWTGEIWARLYVEGRSVERVEGELWR